MRFAVPAALLLFALAAAPAHDALAADSLGGVHPRIVNGVFTSAYPSVGALLQGSTADNAGTWCSGTLIGCETFLTAGHCVEGFAPVDFHVYVPNAGMFGVASIARHPDYDFPIADVAVLKLTTPVNGVPPSAINTTGSPAFGSTGTLVGFGRSGDPNFDYGLKRTGDVATASCTNAPNGGSDATLVCWDFTNPIGAPGTDSNTCNADSGGPLFVDFGSGDVVAGITSGGSSGGCLPTDHSYDANVYTYRSYIQTEGGADLANTTCGVLPQVGDPGTTVLEFSGSLASGTPQGAHSFAVQAGTSMLRVAMNAIDNGPSDYDLYVRFGSAPTTSVFDCKRDGTGQFGVCEFPSPAAGTWYVLVNRFSGAGPYQVTATRFGVDCAAPGSDGASCDDGNVCTDGDTCQLGACTGAPVVNGTPCNDGNVCTSPDTCQAGVCGGAALPNGTACDDGNPCSQPDVCQSGACSGTAPALSCRLPQKSGAAYLRLENRTPDTKDKLLWRWRNGAATTKAEFGSPTTTTPYTLCVYDEVSGTPVRKVLQQLAPGAAWKASTHGYKYRDNVLATSGIQSVQLKEGAAGKASIGVSGKSGTLGLPTLPLTQQPKVLVQLLNGTQCWEARYGTVQQSDLFRFKAKSD